MCSWLLLRRLARVALQQTPPATCISFSMANLAGAYFPRSKQPTIEGTGVTRGSIAPWREAPPGPDAYVTLLPKDRGTPGAGEAVVGCWDGRVRNCMACSTPVEAPSGNSRLKLQRRARHRCHGIPGPACRPACAAVWCQTTLGGATCWVLLAAMLFELTSCSRAERVSPTCVVCTAP